MSRKSIMWRICVSLFPQVCEEKSLLRVNGLVSVSDARYFKEDGSLQRGTRASEVCRGEGEKR